MENLSFNKDSLARELERLDRTRKIAFGVACCERLLPHYLTFKDEVRWGDEQPLMKALNRVWEHLLGGELTKDEIRTLTNKCESVAPDSEDFESIHTSFAQDATFSVCAVLDYVAQDDVERITQVAAFAIDTVDLYVQESQNMNPNDPQLEQKILRHPLMQQELKRQREDIELLKNLDLEREDVIQDLRQRWSNQSKSNIGR